MKQNIFKILLVLLFIVPDRVLGQNKKERIEALQIAILTREMGLTPAEAQNFWPLYNEWQDKLEAIKNKRKELRKQLTNTNSMPHAEAEQLIQSEIQLRYKEVDLLKEYLEKFRKKLPPQKVIMIFKAEEELKKELIKQLKEGR